MSRVDPAPRRVLRTPFPVEVLRPDDAQPRFLGYVSNVSETGLFVLCSNPRQVGTELHVRMHLPGAEATVESDASVVWRRPCRGRSHPPSGMGMRLFRIDIPSAVELHGFCESAAAESPAPGLRPSLDRRRLRPVSWRRHLPERVSRLWDLASGAFAPLRRGAQSGPQEEELPSAAARRFRVWARARRGSGHRQFWVQAEDPAAARRLAVAEIGPDWEVAEVEPRSC